MLVVEVVSESTKSVDYRAKRVEYNVRNIPEYWIVDPLIKKVTVFTLIEDLYEPAEFVDGDRIQSQTFPELELTTGNVSLARLNQEQKSLLQRQVEIKNQINSA